MQSSARQQSTFGKELKMTPDETLRELNFCFNDWPGLLTNRNTILRRNIVAWPHYVPNIEPLAKIRAQRDL